MTPTYHLCTICVTPTVVSAPGACVACTIIATFVYNKVFHVSQNISSINGYRGSTVVKVLCYKLEGRWFDPSWCHWNVSLTQNPSDRSTALGSTQPLTEMSTRSISCGKGGWCIRLTTLPPSCAIVMKSGNLNVLEPSGPLQACNGTDLSLPYV